ncbi:MAG TPA: hypothetical protein VKZ39_00765 [Sphaerochaetaceae bacterium]|jgi:hypothetical protein|nr:hypothetical protein [Sphaerochaetaceae bacterium]
MLKSSAMKKVISLVFLLAVLGVSSLGARVVASETLTIHAYIPQKTTVMVSDGGEVLLSSNVPSAHVGVSQVEDATWLSVTAL